MNAAPEALQGNRSKDYLLDCFARYMLAKWKRPAIEDYLKKHPAKAEDMKARLNHQKGKRP